MGQGYLIDTNVAIDYLGGLLPDNANELIETIFGQISIVTRIELLSWPNATDTDIVTLTSFIKDCAIFPLSENIIITTIHIRKTYKLKLGDAIIAATALELDTILLSRNLSDFSKISALIVINPYLI